jgi:Cu(I)/Ag(I) efflux system membrane fusion protein
VFAPIEGVVTELGAREGATFMSGATLFRINGLSTVWVNAQVPEAKASVVSIGPKVEARATGWPGTNFEGRVIALLPQVDPQTRTLTARVAIDNQDQKLSPAMYVTLDFIAPELEPQLLVPTEAIISTGERNVVIASREGGGFDVVNVELGPEQEGRTVILSGLEEGRPVVLSGQFLIDSEASLKSAANRLEAGAAQSAPMPAMPESAPRGERSGNNEPEAIHTTRGTVTEITADSVTLSHEAVPSLNWPAMTMGFKLPSNGLPDDIKVGDRVTFSFTQGEGGNFRIESITRIETKPEMSR